MRSSVGQLLLALALTSALEVASSFAVLPPRAALPAPPGRLSASAAETTAADGWTDLSPGGDGAVRIRTLSPAPEGSTGPSPGDEVSMAYVGTLAEREWTAADVAGAWLPEQQGLDGEEVAARLLEGGIDGAALADLTEDLVRDGLGVEGRIQCKKLVMAAKRVGRDDPPAGTEFDSSEDRGPYRFPLGAGKVIRATDLAVAAMAYGERAEVVARSDYAYGKDGLRRSDGEVVVPPYATLRFDITLLGKEEGEEAE